VLAGRQRLRAFPANTLEVHQVPEEDRLALEQVEAVAAEPAAGGQDHALGAARRHLDVGGDGVGRVQQQRRVALRDAGHRLRVDELGAARRDVRARRHKARRHGGVQRQHLILLGLLAEDLPQLLHLLGVLGRHVLELGPVLAQVVQFPGHVVEGVLVDQSEHVPRGTDDFRAGDPALVIDGVVAHHLEVLRLVPGRGLGVGLVEGVSEAHAFDRRLLDAVHRLRGGDAADFEDGRHHVDDVMELVADATDVLDVAGPRHAHALAGAAEVRGDLLGPAERRVERPGPASSGRDAPALPFRHPLSGVSATHLAVQPLHRPEVGAETFVPKLKFY
jgi:hypothetical protein